jgi:hypothetical protein
MDAMGSTAATVPEPAAAAAAPALWSRSLVVMIVLMIVTLGFYHPVWFLRRRNALNHLDSPVTLAAWPFLVYLAYLVFVFVIALATVDVPSAQLSGLNLVMSIIRLAVGILVIVQAFRVKRILEDHLAGPGDTVTREIGQQPVLLSGILTFFLSIFYLQYVINHYVLPSERSR